MFLHSFASNVSLVGREIKEGILAFEPPEYDDRPR